VARDGGYPGSRAFLPLVPGQPGNRGSRRGEGKGVDPYELLTSQAAEAPAGCEGLLYLPYLMGERTPHLDPWARGVFFGLTARHTRAHMIRAVLEGVAYSLRDGLEIFRSLGVPSTQVRASGGGGKSPLWRQIQADVFDREMVTTNSSEGSAYGVALLAATGTGAFSSVQEACRACIRVTERCSPDPGRARLYEEYYAIYRALYRQLKDQFRAVASIENRGRTSRTR